MKTKIKVYICFSKNNKILYLSKIEIFFSVFSG